MNPFVTRISRKSWELPVAVLSLVLGVMVYFAWITENSRTTRIPLLGADQQDRLASGTLDLQTEYKRLSAEVSKLREENTKLENATANESKQAQILNDRLQEVKAFAGLSDVEGTGITITLRDGRRTTGSLDVMGQVIHDSDVLRVVNELWSAGAEAISVNGHRVVATTSFRCVGPVIFVQGIPISSPVVIRAIGDADTLVGAMNLPGGVLEAIRETDTEMVQIEKVSKHRFEAFNGPTTLRFLKVPPTK